MPRDLKYGEIKIEASRGEFHEGEPVFLLRAKDLASLAAIRAYFIVCMERKCPKAFLDGILDAEELFAKWQRENPGFTKNPD